MELSSISIAITSLVGALFSPGAIFTTGVNGAWYDPSDFSTMFQDAAGTTPVTAVGQPVGLMKDKSGRGNHAFNPSGNSANFPVLSARYNLLTNTEFTGVVAGTPGTAPTGWSIGFGGGSTALPSSGVITMSVAGAARQYLAQSTISAAANSSVTVSFVVTNYSGSSSENVFVANVTAGSLTGSIILAASQCPVGSRSSITLTAGAAGATFEIRIGCGVTGSSSGAMSISFTAPDLRVANDALNQPAYQRVNTSSDYDTVGFKPYLSFNGVNQWLQTNSIDFTYGDKMFVSAGVRELSDVIGCIAETSSDSSVNNGAFYVINRGVSINDYLIGLRGTSFVYDQFFVAPPTTSVIAFSTDIGQVSRADELKTRLDGAAASVTRVGATAGTGNYGNYPMYIGARAGTSLFFNGCLYGLVVAGKQASASETASTEAWLNQKTGAYEGTPGSLSLDLNFTDNTYYSRVI